MKSELEHYFNIFRDFTVDQLKFPAHFLNLQSLILPQKNKIK